MTPYHKRNPQAQLVKYTFKGLAEPKDRSVYADSEKEARDLAMRLQWGPPDGAVVKSSIYKGAGLELVSVEEIMK